MNGIFGVIYSVFLMLAFQAVSMAPSFDLFAIVDKYGYPTAVSLIAFAYFSRQNTKQSDERNKLIKQNNDLTERLLESLEKKRECKYDGYSFRSK